MILNADWLRAALAGLVLLASPLAEAADSWVSEPAPPLRPAEPERPRLPREARPPGRLLYAPKAEATLADQVTYELERCRKAGIASLVDCLRNLMSSVMIRRLEACIRSEHIPEGHDEVRACLSAGQW